MESFSLTWIDWAIMLIYFVFVLGIGWALKKYMSNATAFLEAGRSLPAWITGLAFISANLGALEVMGMAASGAKYGMATVHFYWIGAIPAMIFLAIFMMPFYYGSKARSVPEYLKLRFDEKTRGFNAFSFAIMTIFASGISMYALATLAKVLLPIHFEIGPFSEFDLYLFVSAIIVLVYTYLGGLRSAIYNEVRWLGWYGRKTGFKFRNCRLPAFLGKYQLITSNGRCDRNCDGAWICTLIRILVHQLPCCAASYGCRFNECCTQNSPYRCHSENVHPLPCDHSGHNSYCSA